VDDPFEKTLPTVHEVVRKSKLLFAFHDKLSALPAGSVSLVSEFGRLRDIVASQIGNTQVLFPEFTPHDEPLHVAKLFQLADTFFDQVYIQLNAAELFLLASALYAHDWGMAVGSDEKRFLKAGAHPSLLRDTFAPLSDEYDRMNKFMRSEGLRREPISEIATIPDQNLREYVRQTHARRSAVRVRAFFHEHSAIGDAIGRLCEGHWLDFASLDNPDRFQREYKVAGQTTHLLALALQVRLIDLFHITDDRTPFALWRFVSPTDNRSALEWKKHRVLNAVSVANLKLGRAIKIQTSTIEDEEVWAGIQDLKRYCEEQIRRTSEISVRDVPTKYGLDFLMLEWNIPTGSLRPVDFRFSFDRAAMFRILSDDIYEGNQYVFLRELLQNSIDAISVRLAKHADIDHGSLKKLRSRPFDTTIYFRADHQANGDIIITCRDYGIGMDEHIIRNYFSVAGVSYYRSREFERQEFGFEPISRFGVGILSCFMASDGLEIKTYHDPVCAPTMAQHDGRLPSADEHRARRLFLKIPSVDRQFIVKDIAEDFHPGTEVRLHLKAVRLKKERINAANAIGETELSNFDGVHLRTLKITEYLCEIAGFVKYPIHIIETWPGNPTSPATLILHPDCDAQIEAEEFEDTVKVHQLSRAYPWDEVTEPECIPLAKQQMVEHCFELSQLPGTKEYRGWIVFPKPKNEHWDFSNVDIEHGVSMQRNAVIWRDRDTSAIIGERIGWLTPMQYSEIKEMPRHTLFAVYRDGIRLDRITNTKLLRLEQVFPLPMIHVNLPSVGSVQTNLARTALNTEMEKWDDEILAAIVEAVKALFVKMSSPLTPSDRFHRLGWIGSVFRVPALSFIEENDPLYMPTAWMVPGKGIEVRESPPKDGDEVPVVPRELGQAVRALICNQWLQVRVPNNFEFCWQGPISLIESINIQFSAPLRVALEITNYWVSKYLLLSRIQFLNGPGPTSAPLVQYVFVVSTAVEREHIARIQRASTYRTKLLNDPLVVESISIARSAPERLQPLQRKILAIVSSVPAEKPALLPLPFAHPFTQFCSSGNDDLNSRHPIGAAVSHCISAFIAAERDGRLAKRAKDRLVELVHKIWMFRGGLRGVNAANFGSREIVAGIFQLVLEYQIIEGFVPPQLPSNMDWVPGNHDNLIRTQNQFGDREYMLAILGKPLGSLLV
jgi:hypothetical protein